MKFQLSQIDELVKRLAELIEAHNAAHGNGCFSDVCYVYCIPRGGVPVGAFLAAHLTARIVFVDTPEAANVIIDDILDTGVTIDMYRKRAPTAICAVLVTKQPGRTDVLSAFDVDASEWVAFPWEAQGQVYDDSIVGTLTNRIKSHRHRFYANDNVSGFITDCERSEYLAEVGRRVEHLLQGLLIDTEHDHNTKGTALRIAKMYVNEVFRGRFYSPPTMVRFPNVKKLDQMYTTGPITVRSACSHHFVPIVGKCWIGIIPGEFLPGLSKFNRIVDWFCARPQIQEELVVQIADYLEEHLKPKGIAVYIQATHMCMTWRGVRESDAAKMTTTVVRGSFVEQDARSEFLATIKMAN